MYKKIFLMIFISLLVSLFLMSFILSGFGLSLSSDNAAFMNGIILNGQDQIATGSMSTITMVAENTDTQGWHVDIFSTNFININNPSRMISSLGFSVPTQPEITGSGSGDLPTSSAGTLGGGGFKLVSATVGNGIGTYYATPALRLSVPAQTYSGTYQVTVSTTIQSGP